MCVRAAYRHQISSSHAGGRYLGRSPHRIVVLVVEETWCWSLGVRNFKGRRNSFLLPSKIILQLLSPLVFNGVWTLIQSLNVDCPSGNLVLMGWASLRWRLLRQRIVVRKVLSVEGLSLSLRCLDEIGGGMLRVPDATILDNIQGVLGFRRRLAVWFSDEVTLW